MVFQDYATKKDGIEFSQKAKEESYLEAERLLGKLKDERFNWLGIQWDQIDLSDIGQYQKMEERLSAVANQLLISQGGNILPEEIKEIKGKGLALSMTLSISILLSMVNLGLANNVSADELKSKQTIESSHGEAKNPAMQEIKVDHDANDLRVEKQAVEKLEFLMSFYDDKEGYSKARDAIALTAFTNISPKDAFKYYDKIKAFVGDGEPVPAKIEAVVKLMKDVNFEAEDIKTSLRRILKVELSKENFEIKNGVIRIKDCFEKGFDFIMSNNNGEIRIGIDGPGSFDWGFINEGSGALAPNELLTVQSLRDAKMAAKGMSQ